MEKYGAFTGQCPVRGGVYRWGWPRNPLTNPRWAARFGPQCPSRHVPALGLQRGNNAEDARPRKVTTKYAFSCLILVK
jgi:hypothetical protein